MRNKKESSCRGVMHDESRRRFLKSTAGAACAATLAGTLGKSLVAGAPSPAPPPIKKGILLDMLPANLSCADRLKLAREIGFEVLQAPTEPDEHKAEELRKAADAAQIRIDSVMNMDHWKYPLSSSDPTVVEKSLAGMRTSLQNAKLWGSDVVLLVPAVLNPQTSYRDAWSRSQREIRKLLPLAEELKVVIAMEEVWNRFLLGPRIVKVHLKDFKRNKDSYAWVNLGEGDIDWAAVREAFAAINYTGSATVELPAGDEAYLRDVSRRVDTLLLNHS